MTERKKPKQSVINVSIKLVNGERLTPREFGIAVEDGMLSKDISFNDWDSTWYEDDHHFGYLHIVDGKIHSDGEEEIKEDGRKVKHMCLWGIHRDGVDESKLRPEQKKYW